MKFKLKIYIFFFVLIFALILIALFNRLVDPYEVFKKSSKINILEILIDQQFIPLKLHKNNKYDYVYAGDSTFKDLHLELNDEKIANICYPLLEIENLHKILYTFLDMHPETKTVFLPLDFIAMGVTHKYQIPQYTGENLNSKEIYKLFFSIKTLKLSFKKLASLKKNDLCDRVVSINIKKRPIKKSDEKIYVERGKKEYTEIFKELKKRNVNVVVFTSPSPATGLVFLKDLYTFEAMAEMKKFVVEQNGYLIDTGIINKHTKKPLSEQFYLFSNIFHPTRLYGYFVYNILLDTKEKDKDLYVVLTKDNVDFELKKQKEELIKWEKEHKKEYEDFLDENKEPKKIKKTINDIPKEYRELYLQKNTNCN